MSARGLVADGALPPVVRDVDPRAMTDAERAAYLPGLAVAQWPAYFRHLIRPQVDAYAFALRGPLQELRAAAEAASHLTGSEVSEHLLDVQREVRDDLAALTYGQPPRHPGAAPTVAQEAQHYRAILDYRRGIVADACEGYDGILWHFDDAIEAADASGDRERATVLRAVRADAYPRLPNDAADFGGFLDRRIGEPLPIYHWRVMRDHAPWQLRAGDVVAFVAEGGALWRMRVDTEPLPIEPRYSRVLGLEREGVLELAGAPTRAPAAPRFANATGKGLPVCYVAARAWAPWGLTPGDQVVVFEGLWAVAVSGERRRLPDDFGAVVVLWRDGVLRLADQADDAPNAPALPVDPRTRGSLLERGVWQAPWTLNGEDVLVAIGRSGELLDTRQVPADAVLVDALRAFEQWLEDADPTDVVAGSPEAGGDAEADADEGGEGEGAEGLAPVVELDVQVPVARESAAAGPWVVERAYGDLGLRPGDVVTYAPGSEEHPWCLTRPVDVDHARAEALRTLGVLRDLNAAEGAAIGARRDTPDTEAPHAVEVDVQPAAASPPGPVTA